jgi:hypothetical protein
VHKAKTAYIPYCMMICSRLNIRKYLERRSRNAYLGKSSVMVT